MNLEGERRGGGGGTKGDCIKDGRLWLYEGYKCCERTTRTIQRDEAR